MSQWLDSIRYLSLKQKDFLYQITQASLLEFADFVEGEATLIEKLQ
jgi:hypothetical protein